MKQHSPISRITLGTVQLGLPYGIANKGGQPTTQYSHELLQCALENRIHTLDTARIYGTAEEVIGSFAHHQQFTIVSKFKLSDDALDNIEMAVAEARESLHTSARYLSRTCIPIGLFHKNKDQDMLKVARILPEVLMVLKKENLIQEGGISVYAPGELSYIEDWEQISAVQVPLNILDTRLLEEGRMELLVRQGVKVFIRSIYLQGLLLLNVEALPPHLAFAAPYLQQLKALAAVANKSIADLAFSFVRDTPGVTSLVVGAETTELLQENIRLLQSSPLPQALHIRIRETFKNIPQAIITPALWNT